MVGIVGEIFLRMHVQSNQDMIRILERYGAEVVNSSLAEWVNYISYGQLRENKTQFRLHLRQFNVKHLKTDLAKMLNFGSELYYQE